MLESFFIVGDTYPAQEAIKKKFPGAIFDRNLKGWAIQADEAEALRFVDLARMKNHLVLLDKLKAPVDKTLVSGIVLGDTKPVSGHIKKQWPEAFFSNVRAYWFIGLLYPDEVEKAKAFCERWGIGLSTTKPGQANYTVVLEPKRGPATQTQQGPSTPASGPSTPSHFGPGEFLLSEGEGYGGYERHIGEVFAAPKRFQDKGDWLIVVKELSPQYYREDGLSFGVGDDRGYIFKHVVRPATDDESLPARMKKEKGKVQQETRVALRKLIDDIQKKGERPRGSGGESIKVDGEELENPMDKGSPAYGGGSWFIFQSSYIWFIRNNGGDGDDWGQNNVRTGGAGAIGWRVHRDRDLEDSIRQFIKIIEA